MAKKTALDKFADLLAKELPEDIFIKHGVKHPDIIAFYEIYVVTREGFGNLIGMTLKPGKIILRYKRYLKVFQKLAESLGKRTEQEIEVSFKR